MVRKKSQSIDDSIQQKILYELALTSWDDSPPLMRHASPCESPPTTGHAPSTGGSGDDVSVADKDKKTVEGGHQVDIQDDEVTSTLLLETVTSKGKGKGKGQGHYKKMGIEEKRDDSDVSREDPPDLGKKHKKKKKRRHKKHQQKRSSHHGDSDSRFSESPSYKRKYKSPRYKDDRSPNYELESPRHYRDRSPSYVRDGVPSGEDERGHGSSRHKSRTRLSSYDSRHSSQRSRSRSYYSSRDSRSSERSPSPGRHKHHHRQRSSSINCKRQRKNRLSSKKKSCHRHKKRSHDHNRSAATKHDSRHHLDDDDNDQNTLHKLPKKQLAEELSNVDSEIVSLKKQLLKSLLHAERKDLVEEITLWQKGLPLKSLLQHKITLELLMEPPANKTVEDLVKELESIEEAIVAGKKELLKIMREDSNNN